MQLLLYRYLSLMLLPTAQDRKERGIKSCWMFLSLFDTFALWFIGTSNSQIGASILKTQILRYSRIMQMSTLSILASTEKKIEDKQLLRKPCSISWRMFTTSRRRTTFTMFNVFSNVIMSLVDEKKYHNNHSNNASMKICYSCAAILYREYRP